MDSRRAERGFPRGPLAGAEGSRPFGLLLAPGHRRGLHAGVHPGGSGRPAVQAAGLHEEPGDGDCRRSGHHARPGDSDAVHAHGLLQVPAPVACRGVANTLCVGRYFPEEQHPISKWLFRVYEPACRFVLRHKAATLIAALLLVLTTIPVYFQLGSEFMPPLNEGSLLYMPTTMPGISVAEARRLAANNGPAVAAVSRGGTGVRQGGPGRNLHRPRPALNGRNHHRAQAGRPVAAGQAVVFQLPRFPSSPAAAHLARPHQPRRVDRRDERGDAVSGCGQRLDHAHPGTDRHAEHGRADPRRHQDSGGRPARDREDRRPAGVDLGANSRLAQRVRRAYRRRLFSRLHVEARRVGPLRTHYRRSGNGGSIGRRRRSRLDHRGRARALHDQRPLRPRLPPRPAQAPPGAGANSLRGPDSTGPTGRHRVGFRPGHAPRRERDALGLRLRGPGRARRGQLRRGGQAGCAAKPRTAHRLYHRLERPV